MRSRPICFNRYLWCLLALAVGVAVGCTSLEDRRKNRVHYTELWLHAVGPQASPDTNRMMIIEVAGMRMPVHRRPFLTEEHLVDATVIDSPGGGYALQLRFDDHGRLLLESHSTANRGNHVAVFARYGIRKDQKKTPLEERWLAAPLITRPLVEGVIVFTPSVSKVELYQIVDGLQKAAELAAKPWVF
jgi:hypothetical protein